MESITACARARDLAISTESVRGGMIFPAGSRAALRSRAPGVRCETDARCNVGSRRVMPHDATAKRVNRRIPNLFTGAKFAKSSHFAKIEPA